MLRALAVLLAFLGAVLSTVATASPAVLMRHASVSATRVAFVARGDLWTARRNGGDATRIVRSSGAIVAERFSPNGRWIAYTDRVDGGQDVYVVSVNGGTPKRLTFGARSGIPGGASQNLVIGWTPDSSQIVFLSGRGAYAYLQLRAFLVPRTGGLAHAMPIGQSGQLSFSATGQSIIYTRTFTDLDHRKRYVGGEAENLFRYDLATHRLVQLTHWKGTDTAPMWVGNQLYFLSDRGPYFRLNLWVRNLKTGSLRQMTHFKEFDIGWPAYGAGRIVFQQAGRLWSYDIKSAQLQPLDIELPDKNPRTRPRIAKVGDLARATDATGAVAFGLSPDGGVAVIAAHGDIFRVSTTGGRAVDLTNTPGIDEEQPVVSSDGRWEAYVTEDSHAQQIAMRPLAGGAQHLLTHFKTGVFYQPVWARNGKALLAANTQHQVWLISTTGKFAPRLVAYNPVEAIRDATFSPDERWIAYSTMRETGQSALHLENLPTGKDDVLSSPMEDDRDPRFSANGKRLIFISRRNALPLASDRDDQTSFVAVDSDDIFSMPVPTNGDIKTAIARTVRLAAPPAEIASLHVCGHAVFYITDPLQTISGNLPGGKTTLHRLEGHTDKLVASGFDAVAISADGQTIVTANDGNWQTIHGANKPRTLDLSGMTLRIVPRLQWREAFCRTWRLYRDSFFSPVMNGNNWVAIRNAYARFLPMLGSRDDLAWLLGQLQGELATSHAFLDATSPPGTIPHPTPLLGANFALNARSGRYYFSKVFQGDPTRPEFRAPLNAPNIEGTGVHVQAGTYLLAVNGVELKAPTVPNALLARAKTPLHLTIANRPDGPRRTVVVQPLREDIDLRQYAWVQSNREKVDRLSHGKIGYVFLADFEQAGIQDLIQQLQGQLDKQGLIIDIRWNIGGYMSQGVLALLRRIRAGGFANRERAFAPLPRFVAPRNMATIINAETSSDGDQFAYYFRKFGLGPVVGQRSWGGVQGINGVQTLMNGMEFTVAKDSLADSHGHWIIENFGAVPTIPVNPAPDGRAMGHDKLLQTAVAAVMHEIAAHPQPKMTAPPPLPAYPIRGEVPPSSIGRHMPVS